VLRRALLVISLSLILIGTWLFFLIGSSCGEGCNSRYLVLGGAFAAAWVAAFVARRR
jgi:hypothetical protein